MTNKTYQLSETLAIIYNEVRTELAFGFALASLLDNIHAWNTDILNSLKQAYRHLYKASSILISETEKTGQILLAELHIRDLVEHLSKELTAYCKHVKPTGR